MGLVDTALRSARWHARRYSRRLAGGTRPLYATPRVVRDLADCHFYHSFTLPQSGEVSGEWDLRPNVDAYLGGVGFEGKRVLEIGPASGYLTFHMESRGASVTAVELSEDVEWDYVPQAGVDMSAIREDRRVRMDGVRNAFWLAHREFGSRARLHYGTAYDLPDELGTFDIAVLGAVLLHVRDPMLVVQNVARIADTVVIVDADEPGLGDEPLAKLIPSGQNGNWDTWWHFTPQLFVQFFGVLGFPEVRVTRHEQLFVGTPIALFTAVGTRQRP